MKASDFIAKKLSNHTNHVFSGQGGSVVHILDSLSRVKGVRIIPSQNEQGASLAADAYYRSSGKIGVVEIPLMDSFQVDTTEDLELIRKII